MSFVLRENCPVAIIFDTGVCCSYVFWGILNPSPPEQNGRHFPDDTFKCILMMFFISIRILLKFVPNGPIANKAALIQVMAWRRTGDKPLH